ncbi:hypothetical protein [Chitinophaga sp. MM2321]|uniref:hypothetical protein n=1 Tax=Chitinophaga sp. MM2321 TaxID=3137178 RepID=UPI0032D574DD
MNSSFQPHHSILIHSHFSEDEHRDPVLAIDRFCQFFPQVKAHNLLWQWLSETLTAEGTEYDDVNSRADLLFFYSELIRLLDTNYILYCNKLAEKGNAAQINEVQAMTF